MLQWAPVSNGKCINSMTPFCSSVGLLVQVIIHLKVLWEGSRSRSFPWTRGPFTFNGVPRCTSWRKNAQSFIQRPTVTSFVCWHPSRATHIHTFIRPSSATCWRQVAEGPNRASGTQWDPHVSLRRPKIHTCRTSTRPRRILGGCHSDGGAGVEVRPSIGATAG